MWFIPLILIVVAYFAYNHFPKTYTINLELKQLDPGSDGVIAFMFILNDGKRYEFKSVKDLTGQETKPFVEKIKFDYKTKNKEKLTSFKLLNRNSGGSAYRILKLTVTHMFMTKDLTKNIQLGLYKPGSDMYKPTPETVYSTLEHSVATDKVWPDAKYGLSNLWEECAYRPRDLFRDKGLVLWNPSVVHVNYADPHKPDCSKYPKVEDVPHEADMKLQYPEVWE